MIIPRRTIPPDLIYSRSRAKTREILVQMFRELGLLYGVDYDTLEAGNIRDAAEELGIPMGYGRIGKPPTQVPGWQPREPLAPTDTLGRRGRVSRRRKQRAPSR